MMISGLGLVGRGGQSCGVMDSSSDELYITPLTATEELRSAFDSQSPSTAALPPELPITVSNRHPNT